MEKWNRGTISLIVFDIDGTLAETDDYFVERGVVLSRKVLPFVKERSMEKIIRPLVQASETGLHLFYHVLDFFGLDGLISKIHNRLSVKEAYKYEQISGMQETLKLLAQKYKLGIISSGGRRSTQSFIDKFALGNLVSYVISAEDCPYIKPHPMPLRKIAEEAGVPVQNSMMVGDTIFDILCAKRAGAYSAAVRSGFDTNRFLTLHHPDLLLDSVADLPEILL